MYENINTLLNKFGTISEDYQNIEAAVDELKSQIKKLDYKMFQLRKKNDASIQSLESIKRKSQDVFSDEKLSTIMDELKAEQASIATSQELLTPMLEGMAHVVEAVTRATQSALDANSRIVQKVARIS